MSKAKHQLGQMRRKQDWLVGQHLRKTSPIEYQKLLEIVIESELDFVRRLGDLVGANVIEKVQDT